MREIENPSRLLFNGLVAENAQHRLADPTRTSHDADSDEAARV